jgi:quinolinate synthase
MTTALGSLAMQQASPTENTMSKIKQFMYYLVTHPDAIVVTYHANNMVLKAHSDASYLSKSNARSCAGVNFSCPTTHLPPPTAEQY